MNVQKNMVVVVEISKIGSDFKATLDQHDGRVWICSASVPFHMDDVVGNDVKEICDKYDGELVGSEEGIDHQWGEEFEKALYEKMVPLATISNLYGLAVYEVIMYARGGVAIKGRSRGFIVFQRQSVNAIYTCDTAEQAYGVVRDLLKGEELKIDMNHVTKIISESKGVSALGLN